MVSDLVKNAAQGIIDVSFTPSLADLKVLVRNVPDRLCFAIVTILSRIGAFAIAAALAGLVLWNVDAIQASVLENVTLAIAGGLIGLMAFRMLFERRWRSSIRKSLFHHAQTLHVTSDGQALTIEGEHVKTCIAFAGIERLAKLETHLIFYRKRDAILALPKAAFAQPEAFEAFASFMQSRMAADQTQQPVLEKTA
ncbi:YcxB family protein [Microvirga solisilvae]|uniref:YcxB family protein n=1 Tax=Microvirga solisilvae TaxID=2919498 RepID=UPI003C6D9429